MKKRDIRCPKSNFCSIISMLESRFTSRSTLNRCAQLYHNHHSNEDKLVHLLLKEKEKLSQARIQIEELKHDQDLLELKLDESR